MKVFFYQTSSGRSPVEKFIEGLSKADQSKFQEVYEGLSEQGLQYKKIEYRQLKGKLWEIKFAAPGGGYRIAYVVLVEEGMVWLHAFKKDSQKMAREHLELAIRRFREVHHD